MQNEFLKQLGIDYPIIQAPMAGGVTTTSLVSAVSNARGLGMIGAGYMTPKDLREQIQAVKRITINTFGVNVFIPKDFNVSDSEVFEASKILQGIRGKLGIQESQSNLPTSEQEWNTFHEQIKVIIEEKVPICSFTFGIPSKEIVSELKRHQIYLIGTATTVEEAILNEENGINAVVVQGMEAGGHRGSFAGKESLIGLMSLIPQVSKRVSIPVIAAGGIMNGQGLIASLSLGAKAVQMGTAFLTCKESGANQAHKKAILQLTSDQSVLTRVYSGKWARGLKNRFYEEMKEFEEQFPAFPVQNALTSQIRKRASQQKNPEYMSLWAGQSASLARNLSVVELIQTVISEAKVISEHN